MDSLITAAARALAVGDPLGALNRVALRHDPPALALSGIAMAQHRERKIHQVELRTGEVLERLEMPAGVGVSGLESNGSDQFFCGGGKSGMVRAVRRPKRTG